MTEFPEPLLALVRDRGLRHLWVGNYPPFDFEAVALLGCTNFRAAPSLHQRFDVVWCYETPVATLGPESLPLLLDELVRFVGGKGVLVLRYDLESGVIPIKTGLGRRLGLSVRVRHEAVTGSMSVTTVFEVERDRIELYRPAPWTFGILPQTTRKENVVAFLKSVRDQDPDRAHEIIICGPEDPDYGFAGPVYLPQTYSAELAETSRKKNDIARAATRPNLLIAHDRYRLDDGFFVGFDQYGYDFDYLAVATAFEDSEPFPSYCHMADQTLRMTPLRRTTDYNTLPGTPFVDGGLMVVKTHVLRAVPMNELSFSNQAEDVELAVALMRRGLPPRFNPYASATTLGVGRSHVTAYLPPSGEPQTPAAEPGPPPPRRPSVARRAARTGIYLADRYQKYGFAVLLLLVAGMQAVSLYLALAGR